MDAIGKFCQMIVQGLLLKDQVGFVLSKVHVLEQQVVEEVEQHQKYRIQKKIVRK